MIKVSEYVAQTLADFGVRHVFMFTGGGPMFLNDEPGRAYNVGSAESLAIAEVAEKVACCFTPKSETRILGILTMGKPVERYVPKTTRAREELGLYCFDRLDTGILRTVEFNAQYINTRR